MDHRENNPFPDIDAEFETTPIEDAQIQLELINEELAKVHRELNHIKWGVIFVGVVLLWKLAL